MNTENSKINEHTNLFSICQERLNLKSSSKHVVPPNFSVYHTWENIKQQCKNNKHKKTAPI